MDTQTGHLSKWKPNSPGAAWYMLIFFSQNICTVYKCFVKKDGIFRPAGGGISCRINDRVTRVNTRTYAILREQGLFACSRMEWDMLFVKNQQHSRQNRGMRYKEIDISVFRVIMR